MNITDYFPDYINIGYTKKTVGINGNLRIHIDPPYKETFSKVKHCFFLRLGCMVPYFVDISPEEIEDEIVKFESCNNPEQARELVSKSIYLLKDQIQSVSEVEQLLTFELVNGYEVVDESSQKIVGKINNIEQYPQQEIATILRESGDTALLPLNFHNVKGIDQDKKLIYVEIPEGLLDL